MDHNGRHMRMALCQQTDLPRQGIRRMSTVDKYRLFVRFCNLHDRIHHRRIRGKCIKKRLHFYPCKIFISQIMLQHIICFLSFIGIYPAKRNDLVRRCLICLFQFLIQMTSCRTKNRFFNIVLLHLFCQTAEVKINVKRTSEFSNVGMCIYFLKMVIVVIHKKHLFVLYVFLINFALFDYNVFTDD